MAVIPTGYAQVNYVYIGSGMPHGAETTFGVVVQPADDPVTVASTFDGLWGTHLRSKIPIALTLASVYVKFGPNDIGPFTSLAVNAAGTGSGQDVQPNTAVIVQKRTAFGGRANRGRWYWPIAEDDMDMGGVADATYLSALAASLSAFRVAAAGAGNDLVVLHNSASLAPTGVSQLLVQTVLGTQRRRLRR